MRNHHRNKYTINSIETISARNHIKDHKRQKLVKHLSYGKQLVFLENGTIKKAVMAGLCVCRTVVPGKDTKLTEHRKYLIVQD